MHAEPAPAQAASASEPAPPESAPPALEPPTGREWAIGIVFVLAALGVVVAIALSIAGLLP